MGKRPASENSILRGLIGRFINQKGLPDATDTRKRQLLRAMKSSTARLDKRQSSVGRIIEKIMAFPKIAEVRDQNRGQEIGDVEPVIDAILATTAGERMAEFLMKLANKQLVLLENKDQHGAAQIGNSFKDFNIVSTSDDRAQLDEEPEPEPPRSAAAADEESPKPPEEPERKDNEISLQPESLLDRKNEFGAEMARVYRAHVAESGKNSADRNTDSFKSYMLQLETLRKAYGLKPDITVMSPVKDGDAITAVPVPLSDMPLHKVDLTPPAPEEVEADPIKAVADDRGEIDAEEAAITAEKLSQFVPIDETVIMDNEKERRRAKQKKVEEFIGKPTDVMPSDQRGIASSGRFTSREKRSREEFLKSLDDPEKAITNMKEFELKSGFTLPETPQYKEIVKRDNLAGADADNLRYAIWAEIAKVSMNTPVPVGSQMISMFPKLVGMKYLGPGTDALWMVVDGIKPTNEADEAARIHDIRYQLALNGDDVRKADKLLANDLINSKSDEANFLMTEAASRALIGAKRIGSPESLADLPSKILPLDALAAAENIVKAVKENPLTKTFRELAAKELDGLEEEARILQPQIDDARTIRDQQTRVETIAALQKRLTDLDTRASKVRGIRGQRDDIERLRRDFQDMGGVLTATASIDELDILPGETMGALIGRVSQSDPRAMFGDALSRFDTLDEEQQDEVVEDLKQKMTLKTFTAEGLRDEMEDLISEQMDIFGEMVPPDVVSEPIPQQSERLIDPAQAGQAQAGRTTELPVKTPDDKLGTDEPLLRPEFDKDNANAVRESVLDSLRDLAEFENFDIMLRTNPNDPKPDYFDPEFLSMTTQDVRE
jgi:hypothetical protein